MKRLAGVLVLVALVAACAPASLADEVSSLRSEVSSLAGSAAATKTANAALDARVKSLERSLGSLQAELAAANLDSAKQSERIDAVQKTTATIAGRLADLCGRVGDYAVYGETIVFRGGPPLGTMFLRPAANFPAAVEKAFCE